LDLDKLASKGRFAFVDGLSGLYLPGHQRALLKTEGVTVLRSPKLDVTAEDITNAIRQLKGSGTDRILLVVDQLDLLLAAGDDEVSAVGLEALLMDLQEYAHGTVVSLSADYPLVSTQQTTLEREHAVFLLSTAHRADYTMSLRLLDTGIAKDVSGVIRITIGDQAASDTLDDQRRIEGKELLYFVGGDGGVKVFERGQ